MISFEPSAILSNISSTQLECTIHCHEYRCMIRLKSGEDAQQEGKPDIFSACVIPIMTDQDLMAAGYSKCDIEVVVPLFPTKNDKNTCRLSHHPAGKLIRTAQLLQKHLPERLNDVFIGLKIGVIDEQHQVGKYESFLQLSEDIIKELLDAVQQHLRKEQSDGSGRNTNPSHKRNASLQSGSVVTFPPPLNYYAEMLRQLKILDNLPNVIDINLHKSDASKDETLTDIVRLSVTCVDEMRRSHTWHAELYPNIVLTVDLPENLSLLDTKLKVENWWDDDKSTPILPEIQRRFKQRIDAYQPLFNELDELDSNLWILEPSLPARRCSFERRIALGEGGASVVIVLDPEKPRAAPVSIRFVGLTAAAMTAAQSLQSSRPTNNSGEKGIDWSTSFAEFVAEGDTEESTAKRWSETRSVQENLELWFGAPLPSPLSSVKSDFLIECGICYTHRLPAGDDMMTDEDSRAKEGALPDVKCSNSTCNRHYHECCLFEWLRSLPTAKNSFDRIFGSCPYCCETVSVSSTKMS